jgi:hypothetical protein
LLQSERLGKTLRPLELYEVVKRAHSEGLPKWQLFDLLTSAPEAAVLLLNRLTGTQMEPETARLVIQRRKFWS